MSVSGKRGVGIPVILLHDAEGGIITVELKNGDSYRGFLEEAQDNMNCTLKGCKKTSADGKESMVEIAYIRGGNVRFIVLPDMLQKAPFFNRIKIWRKYKGHAVMGLSTPVDGPGRGRGIGGRGQGIGGRGQGGFQSGPGGGPGGMGMGMGMGMGPSGRGGINPNIAPPMGRGASAVIPAWQLAQQAHQQAKAAAAQAASNAGSSQLQQQPPSQQQQHNPYGPPSGYSGNTMGRGFPPPGGGGLYGPGR